MRLIGAPRTILAQKRSGFDGIGRFGERIHAIRHN